MAKDREMKEQDERREIAREAVREYLCIQRKKSRKAQAATRSSEEGMELPTYGNTVAQSKE